MEKAERLEELKRKMLHIVNGREDIPDEVVHLLKQSFNKLANKYSELRCDSLAIQEYLQGAFDELKAYVIGNAGGFRKEEQMQNVLYIINRMEREVEEDTQSERSEEKHKERISEMDAGNRQVTVRIMGRLEEALLDVQSRQNRVLASKGYSQDRIEDIQYEVRGFIRHLLAKGENEVYENLEAYDNATKSQLLAAYEDYVLHNRRDEAKKEEVLAKDNGKDVEAQAKHPSARDAFIEEIDVTDQEGLSLEEQNEFAKQVVDKKEEDKGQEPRKEKPKLLSDYFL